MSVVKGKGIQSRSEVGRSRKTGGELAFNQAYEEWIELHKHKRKGESLRKIKDGVSYGGKLFLEQIWWPLFRSFEHLHPEYEVRDFRGGWRYLDFAYIRPPYYICIEFDSFETHARNVDRTQFDDNLLRQNQVVRDDWKVFRFSYGAVTEQKELCQKMLRDFFDKLFERDVRRSQLSLQENEIIRLGLLNEGVVRPIEVRKHLKMGKDKAKRLISNLVSLGILEPIGDFRKIRAYKVILENVDFVL